jgi:hypothetical protein
MFFVVAILVWSILIGLATSKFGRLEQGLLLIGIMSAVLVQYFLIGPS